MKTVLGTFSLVCLVVGIVTLAILINGAYHLQQDIYGWKDRAQVSNEPHKMVEYMTKVKEGMEKWNMTEGNSAFFMPSPTSDMGEIYTTVNDDIVLAMHFETMDPNTDAYQSGLDNLRGAIRELTIPAYEMYANHQVVGVSLLAWAGWILFVVLGFAWLVTDY